MPISVTTIAVAMPMARPAEFARRVNMPRVYAPAKPPPSRPASSIVRSSSEWMSRRRQQQRQADADEADQHRHPLGEAHALLLRRVARERLVEVDRQERRDAVDRARQRAHRRGEDAGDDQSGQARRQLGRDEQRERRVDRQQRIEPLGMRLVVGEQHRADAVEDEAARQHDRREDPDRAPGVLGRVASTSVRCISTWSFGNVSTTSNRIRNRNPQTVGSVRSKLKLTSFVLS